MVQVFMQKFMTPLLIAVLLISCFIRNAAWQNDATLWLDVSIKSPEKPRSYNEIALFYIDRHEYQKAFEPLQRSLQLNPYQPTIYINLGLAYEGVGLPDKAMECYERVIAMSPDDPTAYYNLGLVYYNIKNDRARALSLLLQARDRNPSEPDVHNYLAKIYQDMGRVDLAEEELRRYAELQ
jgi:tetratricopeptide (TPR) repeat protein